MDRRSFLATGGLAAAAPLLATAAASTGVAAGTPGSRRINFATDGLGLGIREYAALLHEISTSGIQADSYSNGGLIGDLERKFAERLGKEAAMFVPTGTLANHIAIRKLAGGERRVLVQADSHVYNDSGDCASVLSGLNLVPLGAGRATMSLDEVKHWVERSSGGRVETRVGVISIENPVRRLDHRRVDVAELERVSRYARDQGIRLHLDGARMFNLPHHTGRSVRDYAALFDTVYVSLWKHFNGMSGAMLAGDATFIEGLFHTRRMFGGSLPQAWPNVAPVERYLANYETEYERAWQTAEALIAALSADRRFRARRLTDGTSRFFLQVTGIAPDAFAERLRANDVILVGPLPDTGEFPLDVNATILRVAPATLAHYFFEAARG